MMRSGRSKRQVAEARKKLWDRRRRRARQNAFQMERLEDRILLASNPRLVAINPNSGELLQEGSVLNIAPQALTFRFDDNQVMDVNTLDAIRISNLGSDGVVSGDDQLIAPGFAGLGGAANEVIVRFASTLPDGHYQIHIGAGLRNVEGNPFGGSIQGGGSSFRLNFRLDLGAQVIAIVPQPITRTPGGLTQQLDKIVVYFNDDDLLDDSTSAENPNFYQLMFTGDTATNTDDVVYLPTSVDYDAESDQAVLTFADALHNLGSGSGTFRLRIGDSSSLPLAPFKVTPVGDPGDTFAAAWDLGAVGSRSQIVSAAIEPQPVNITLPGSLQDPGNRQLTTFNGVGDVQRTADVVDGVTTIAYNFRSRIGSDPSGNPLFNVITETQKQRAREAFEIWSHYLGVQFVETPSSGMLIATGDMRAVNPNINTGPNDGIVLAYEPDPTFETSRLILDNAEAWNNSFGDANAPDQVSYFRFVSAGIGLLLGIGTSYHLHEPVVASTAPRPRFFDDVDQNGFPFTDTNGNGVFDAGEPLEPFSRVESVFPTPIDVTHGQYMFRPDSVDVDLYRFEVTQTGVLTAETLAQRQTDASLLDSALALYADDGQGGFELLARNDDYFGNDSQLRVNLEPGIYYLGVSSTGNTEYHPQVAGSGFGGTTQGKYELRVRVQPLIANQMVDATGTALDGNQDGAPGGVHNFWFQAVAPDEMLVVDKTAAAGGAGSLAAPYRNISSAIVAANSAADGQIRMIRVVGNGGADGNLGTVTDNLPYQIGYNILGQPLQDGADLIVPGGVTLVVDAGAIVKLRQAAILVGSTSASDDRAGAALQVLGTPNHRVYFTSISDDALGIDTDSLTTMGRGGDWGGVQFRRDVDLAESRFTYEEQSIFLDYVNHAELRFGGGVVTLDSVQQVVTPIDMRTARPTVTFNTITRSSDAAMAANPDSFAETNFHAPRFQTTPFTSDYTRVGPDVHGNHVVDNSINALFVRINTPAGNEIEQLTVSARWDDTDVVHVVAENLQIRGHVGGAVGDPISPDINLPVEDRFRMQARMSARLAVDPGVVVKLDGARIDVGIGAQLLAEGTAARNVVFTSIEDRRFGAGGTFDTPSRTEEQAPRAGDWSSLYFDVTSSGSLDHAVVAFGGGLSRIAGTITGFNALEIHQAEVRVAHSLFESNLSGVGGQSASVRGGRGANAPGAIFVLGAQPVIIDNVIQNTVAVPSGDTAAGGGRGPALSVDPSSLNHRELKDYGRSTGMADRQATYDANRGALIRGNRLGDNDLNGMVVRGATLTTQSVWDDTDVVHVVFDTIFVPNFEHFTGIRLLSSASESLVVKFSGAHAGFNATGNTGDVEERIGGILQVAGQPGRPVVLTALSDSTVGAGFDPQGNPQTGTDGGVVVPRTQPAGTTTIEYRFGPTVAQNPAVVDALERAAAFWESRLEDPINIILDADIEDLAGNTAGVATGEIALVNYNTLRDLMIADAREHEQIVSALPTFAQLNLTLPQLNDPTQQYNVSSSVALTTANAKALGVNPNALPQVPSDFDPTVLQRDGRILIDTSTSAETAFYVGIHEIGHALGFISDVDAVDAGSLNIFLNPLDLFRMEPGDGSRDFTNNPRVLDPAREHVFYDGGIFNPVGIPIAGIAQGDIPLSRGQNSADGYQASHWKNESAIEGIYIGLMDPETDGDDPFTSRDARAFDLIGYDVVQGSGLPGEWRGLFIDQYAHDGNVRVISETESPTGGASSNATPSTAQFLGELAPARNAGDDVRRLAFELQGVLGSPSDVDVYSFQADAGTQVWIDIDKTSLGLDTVVELISASGTVLSRSDNSLWESTAGSGAASLTGLAQPLSEVSFHPSDLYSANPLDAGMQVQLPGQPGTRSTYYVRVRSQAGSGIYQMQVRLQAQDEIAGTSVEFADIRYARTGIRITGQPFDSPFVGGISETTLDNSSFDQAQFVGNVVITPSGGLTIAGDLSQFDDIDWYQFEVRYDNIDVPAPGEPVPIVFDIDFADGFGGPDTSIWLFDDAGRLVAYTKNSEVDLVTSEDAFALDTGSGGVADPFLGPIHLFPGTYHVAITSAQEPVALNQIRAQNGIDPLLRVEPVDSIRRVVEDGISTINFGTFNGPISPQILTEELTLTLPAGSQVRDGESVSVRDTATGVVSTFEFTTGLFQIIAPPGAQVLDGETFTLTTTAGQQVFRLTNQGFSLEFLATNTLVDGTVVRIESPTGEVVRYELDSDFATGIGTIRIPFTPGEAPEAVAQRLGEAINLNGPVVSEVSGRVVRVREAVSLTATPTTGIEVVAPTLPGEEPIFFDPEMSAGAVGNQIALGVNRSGIAQAGIAGGSPDRVLIFNDAFSTVTDVQLIAGSALQLERPVQPGNIPVFYSQSDMAPQVALALNDAITNELGPVSFAFQETIRFAGGLFGSPLDVGTSPGSEIQLSTPSSVPFALSDVTLFVSRNFGVAADTRSSIWTIDPYTGNLRTLVGSIAQPLGDVIIRDEFLPGGINLHRDHLYSLTLGPADPMEPLNDGNVGTTLRIDPGTAAATEVGESGIETFIQNPDDPAQDRQAGANEDGVGIFFQAMAMSNLRGNIAFAIGSRGDLGVFPRNAFGENIVYRINLDDGAAVGFGNDRETPNRDLGAGTQIVEAGYIDTLAPDAAGTQLTLVAPTTLFGQRRITDGMTFVIEVPGAPSVFYTYEFNGGPEAVISVNPADTGSLIQDGEAFAIDGQLFTFDTGVVLLAASDANGYRDGDLLTIRDKFNITRVFEFDSNGSLEQGEIAIPFTGSFTALQMRSAIVTAINSAPFFVQATTIGSRITLTRDTSVVTTAPGLVLFGNYGVTDGIAVPVEETFDTAQLADAIVTATATVGIEASVSGTRLNFPGSVVGNFVAVDNLIDQGTSGNIAPTSNFSVPFGAGDTAEELAQRVAAAINGSLVATFATPFEDTVNLAPGSRFDSSTAGLLIGGDAPGGTITGMEFHNGRILAVSDLGGLYEFDLSSRTSRYITTSTDLLDIPFTGMTRGPQNVDGGRYADLFFAIDAVGRLYAFDEFGKLQPIFAGGATALRTGATNPTGLVFSTLDENLWHATGQRNGDPGHGVVIPVTNSRPAVTGGGSFHFGTTSNRTEEQNYDYAGGARGSLISNTFSLADYTSGDAPALFFNYFLETEGTDYQISPFNPMRDSFRVYISSADAVNPGEWHLLATNNSTRIGGDFNDEFDDPDPFDEIALQVQDLFDNTGQWRQARIPLEAFAGQEELRLRFEFSTAGGIGLGSGSGSFALSSGTAGEELHVVAASELRDGNTVDLAFGTTLEFDFGLSLVLPTGSRVRDGETLTIAAPNGTTETFEFDRDGTVADGHVALVVDDSMSARRLAAVVKNAILASDISRTATAEEEALQLFAVADRINLPNAVSITQTPAPAADPLAVFVDGERGVAFGNVPVNVTLGMTASQVAAAMEPALADSILNGNPDAIIRRGNVFRVADRFVLDAGPLQLSTSLWGDFTAALPDLGELFSGDPGDLGGIDNDHEGVYIDDIIIGFTERGEVVASHNQADGNDVPTWRDVPINTDFELLIQRSDTGAITDTRVLDGRYQLEIRQASLYGVPQSGAPNLFLGTDFDTNDPLGANAVWRAPAGSAIVDGQRITLRDAQQSHTFEFVDVTIHELNDTIQDAFPVGWASSADTFVGIGAIGDNRNGSGDNNLVPQGLDVDFLAIPLAAGDLLSVDIDAYNPDTAEGRQSLLDAHLMIWNAAGQRLAFNASTPAADDRTGDDFFLDPSLVFRAPAAGTYYVAVSFEGNTSYNPFVAGSGSLPAFLLPVPPVAGGSYMLTARRNAGAANSAVTPVYYSTFDTAVNIADRLTDAINKQHIVAARVVPRGESNILDLLGDVTLTTEFSNLVPEPNDTIATAIPTGLLPGAAASFRASGRMGDNAELTDDLGSDVDIFAVTLAAGESLIVDVDARRLGHTLDARVVIFDELGVVFAQYSDDVEYDFLTDFWYDPRRPSNASGADGSLADDPFGIFTAPFSGTFYVAMSGESNTTYNPQVEGSGQSFFASDMGKYELNLTKLDGGLAVDPTQEKGDFNLPRPQGQLLVSSTQVRYSREFGIVVEGPTEPVALRNLVNVANTRLIPGVTLVNNVIARNGAGGVLFAGTDRTADVQPVPVPFGRLVNNTIVGLSNQAGFAGVGIEVRNNASPTLMNNIVAENATGILVDASSSSTVNIASLYQNNTRNVAGIGVGDFAILLTSNQPLFTNSESDNFYPAEGSLAIDSSVDSLRDRDEMIAARAALGIPVSPIVAPDRDITGQLRIDDPSVNTPDGQGANVFKDRGAFDAADLEGPLAQLTLPVDNGSQDSNPADGAVTTTDLLTRFEIKLVDTSASGINSGIGVDDATVTPEAVTLTQDGVLLQLGTDYRFGYNAVSNVIRLTPLSGIWPSNATYRISLDNTQIADLAGNLLRPNQLDGTTELVIVSGLGRDWGDAPARYPVLAADNGANHTILAGFYLGNGVSSEGDGQPSEDASADSFDDGVAIPAQMVRGGVVQFEVTASAEGRLSAWVDWNGNGSWADPGDQIFAGTLLSAGVNRMSLTAVPGTAILGETFARFRFSSVGGLLPTGPAPDGEVEDYRVVITANPWQNPANRYDVNANGVIQPLDALLVINELNNPQVSDPETGALPIPVPDGDFAPPFFDVNGDGFVSPLDALLVINQLNAPQASSSRGTVVGRGGAGPRAWTEADEMERVYDDLAHEWAALWGNV